MSDYSLRCDFDIPSFTLEYICTKTATFTSYNFGSNGAISTKFGSITLYIIAQFLKKLQEI